MTPILQDAFFCPRFQKGYAFACYEWKLCVQCCFVCGRIQGRFPSVYSGKCLDAMLFVYINHMSRFVHVYSLYVFYLILGCFPSLGVQTLLLQKNRLLQHGCHCM